MSEVKWEGKEREGGGAMDWISLPVLVMTRLSS
jgi:hypothetical protein